ncbi:MAG: site-specific DNA-methyltransferase [Spirochaetia bacterium]|nr:site-specific DNA-methyltransferase [Spirochaetia bacterium]
MDKKENKIENITENITTNNKPSNQNLEVLKKHFSHCFDKSGNFDFEKFKQELSENEIDFYKESYGLDWLGKSYARILATDEVTTLLKEDEKFNSKEENKNSQNLLIKGDNLEVLKHLSHAYHEKIKMIYIDPPYNTGSDGFVYQDDRKFTVDELKQLAGVDEEKAKRILDFTQSKSNSHSAWLTFMYPRLYIGKRLLKKDGLIAISIDDNELGNLILLMDELFGNECMVAIAPWLSEPSGGKEKTGLRSGHEYIVIYHNGDSSQISQEEVSTGELNKKDKIGPYRKGRELMKWGGTSLREDRPKQFYKLLTPEGIETYPIRNDGKEGHWRWGEANPNIIKAKENPDFFHWELTKFDAGIKWNGKSERWVPYEKIRDKKKTVGWSTWLNSVGYNSDGTNELKELFGEKIFDTPKPTSLIKWLISIHQDDEALILDFFAGSGATGDAVIQLNTEDTGNRKYILIQIPEVIDSKKNKTVYDFVKNNLDVTEPTIFDVTKERLLRSSAKIQSGIINTKNYQKASEQLTLNDKDEKIKELTMDIENLKNQDLGFKIFETMPVWADYNIEADELNSQTKLFDESKLTEEDVKALLVTWKTYDGLLLTEHLEIIYLGGYTGFYGQSKHSTDKLYLMHKGFTTDHLKALLEKIDSDAHFNPASIIAFGYHFESKNLREISENIKSYANKKQIDIDFITRY